MAELAHIMIRTSVVCNEGRWLVRVRVEKQEGIFVGPFKDEADADLQGRKIAKLVKRAFGVADA